MSLTCPRCQQRVETTLAGTMVPHDRPVPCEGGNKTVQPAKCCKAPPGWAHHPFCIEVDSEGGRKP